MPHQLQASPILSRPALAKLERIGIFPQNMPSSPCYVNKTLELIRTYVCMYAVLPRILAIKLQIRSLHLLAQTAQPINPFGLYFNSISEGQKMATSTSGHPPTYGDCVSSLRTSLSFLESSVSTLGTGVSDFPRLISVLKTVRVRLPSPPPSGFLYLNKQTN